MLHAKGDTIMHQPFPLADEQPRDADAEAAIEWLKAVVTPVRNIRGELNVAPGREIELLLQGGGPEDRNRLRDSESLLRRLAKAGEVRWVGNDEDPSPVAVQIVDGAKSGVGTSQAVKVMVPMAGLIDVDAERARLAKAIDKTGKDLTRAEAKLANANFIAKAPPAVVANEQDKRGRLADELDALRAQLTRLDETRG